MQLRATQSVLVAFKILRAGTLLPRAKVWGAFASFVDEVLSGQDSRREIIHSDEVDRELGKDSIDQHPGPHHPPY
jgi:hypothetical protein